MPAFVDFGVSFCHMWLFLVQWRFCWTCQKLYQEQHLQPTHEECAVYQETVQMASTNLPKGEGLGPNIPCSYSTLCHYSSDFAQQVQLPHDPMQPEPMYFLPYGRLASSAFCCEAIPQQVIEGLHCHYHYLHYVFEHYSFGEIELYLHCDKNNYVLAYLFHVVCVDGAESAC